MDTLQIESLISDLALILVLGAVASILFKLLKQPVVLGYIVAGFLASPHFSLLPSVASESNIEFWAQIGIVVLLFSIGLEFSFKKLLNVGGSAFATTLIIVLGMLSTGFVVGKMLGYEAIDSLFLGGMLSMSSTTIIIKALGDLNLKGERFAPLVLAVLIVEDLVAVVLMVVLSSIAVNRTVEGSALAMSIGKLVFFLVMWFTVGMFVIPSLINRFYRLLTDELLLVTAMGLCFLMAILAVKVGFSLALGAFVMGSILAGTVMAERIERVITPVKDLFGAVFFISVGMMVNPHIIAQYWGTIALLAAVVVVGMIFFGTFGMLATGQSLRVAMQSGFCLTQIGEFSFIIASMGLSLGVLGKSLYPIIVAVSVITTFFTPFFIKQAMPCYNWLATHLPQRWNVLIEGYGAQASARRSGAEKPLWAKMARNYVGRLLLYSIIIVALVLFVRTFVWPHLPLTAHDQWGRLLRAVVAVVPLTPFLYAIVTPRVSKSARSELVAQWGKVSYVPLGMFTILGVIVAMGFVMWALHGVYSSHTSVLVALGLTLLTLLVMAPVLNRRVKRMEDRFASNVNQRENRRTGRDNLLVSDLRLAFVSVGYGCPFVGERLRNADLRRKCGVNVASIQRNSVTINVPTADMRIFPGDTLGVIGNDEQIAQLLALTERCESKQLPGVETKFVHFALGPQSPLIGKRLGDAHMREDYSSMLVGVQRGDEFLQPVPSLIFEQADEVWVVGDPKRMKALKGRN